MWISCTILDEDSDIGKIYESFVSVIYSTLTNSIVSRAIIHVLDTATYIGWIYDTKYAVSIDARTFSTIKNDLFLTDTDTLIVDAECIHEVPQYVKNLSLVYDCRSDVYPDCFIPDDHLSVLSELYIRLRGYNQDSIDNILDDILYKDLHQMTVLIAPFSIEQVGRILEKWPIQSIGVSVHADIDYIEQLSEMIHVVICIYDPDEQSGMLSNSFFNMYIPHNEDIIM